VLLIAGISGAVTLVVGLFPRLNVAYQVPNVHAAFVAAAFLTVVLTGFVVVTRFLLRPRLTELALACSLGAFAVSELLLITVPSGPDPVWRAAAVWSALGVAAIGAALFTLAAYAPGHDLVRPGPALFGSSMVVLATLTVVLVATFAFAGHLPPVPLIATGPGAPVRPTPDADTRLLAIELVMTAAYLLAAHQFLRRSRQSGDEFFGLLAIAAVLAAAVHVNNLLYPTLLSPYFSLGDVFRLSFYVVLLAAAAREMRGYWLTLPELSVRLERERIARDLHDGLAQELAYLLRHLDSPDGAASEQAKSLLRAARRAQVEARMAITALSSLPEQLVSVSVAEAVGVVAAREGVEVRLDIAPDLRLSGERAEALVRIACEAVQNAARHSGSKLVLLTVTGDGQQVRLCVRDTGRGFQPHPGRTGFGLISMRQRAHLVGGDLRVSSSPGRGSQVEAVL
jgi:signal transduction histidine kinase